MLALVPLGPPGTLCGRCRCVSFVDWMSDRLMLLWSLLVVLAMVVSCVGVDGIAIL